MKKLKQIYIFLSLMVCLSCYSIKLSSISLNVFKPEIIQIQAKFNNTFPSNIKLTESKINFPTKEVLTEPLFFDKENVVFIGNQFDKQNRRIRTFFKTIDGGKTWQSNAVPIPKDSGISQFYFVNPSIGWMVLFNNGIPWEDSKQTWLMKTVDGGKTWNINKTAYKTIYEELFFTDEKNGWMIGSEYSLEPTVVAKPLVYKTTDGGENWIETSQELRKLIGFHFGSAKTSPRNLLIQDAQTIKLTNKYSIFESNDAGKTWHIYGINFDFLREQNAIGNLGKIGQTNRIKAAQGGLTVEGRYVYLATEESDGTWVNREIKEPINLSNAEFITEKDVFLFANIQEGFRKQDWENQPGVIYYSSDGGNSFSKIYQTKNSVGFGNIHKVSERQFFVVGNDGQILNIEF